MKILNYPSKTAEEKVLATIKRGLGYTEKDYNDVNAYIQDVKDRGDEAVCHYTNKFDSKYVNKETLKVTDQEFQEAHEKIDCKFFKALDRAVAQIKSFHLKQIQNSWIDTPREGVMIGQMVHPVDAAGIYVPGSKGGKTPLISSVIMGGVPAKVAGVASVSLMTPPMENGKINPYILATAKKVGIDKVFKAGSAWAIAALAYGTETIPKVNVIVGPGNLYVTLAKKIVSGIVGIDMIAGPSEILIIADKKADPKYIAADLLSQAEHDAMASAMLVTDSKNIATKTKICVEEQLENLSRKKIASKSIRDFGTIMIVSDINRAIELSNRLAPEHLELLVKSPFEYVGKIKNAGAIFLGPYCPEPIGDYIAGPNHVLPTAGTAKFSSALSVDTFKKRTSLLQYSKQAFEKEADDVITIAEIEGLDGHANSIKIRK